jgi:hypothetical protein
MPLNYLTKSRFVDGRVCPRRLWLSVNEPKSDSSLVLGSPAHIGTIVGEKARTLFPTGVLVNSQEHSDALKETKKLMNDGSVDVIFEAALEYMSVRVRIDILKRLPNGQWQIIEVKSSFDIKDHHLDDIAVQYFVANGCGLNICSVKLLHPKRRYKRGVGEVDWERFFESQEKYSEIIDLQVMVANEVSDQFEVLNGAEPTNIIPLNSDRRCKRPINCEYWEHCTGCLPKDWVQRLYRFDREKVSELAESGVYSVQDLTPAEVRHLKGKQLDQYNAVISRRPYVSSELSRSLEGFGPPAYYLDFEFNRCVIPLHPNTRTNELLAFQWSCHFVSSHEELMAMSVDQVMTLDRDTRPNYHHQYLAEGTEDPSEDCARALLEVLGNDDLPILVHFASAETQAIKSLAERTPNHSTELLALLPRLKDLQTLTEQHVFMPEFFEKPLALDVGTYSIKNTAKAFDPDFDYDKLKDIAKGSAASDAYYRLMTGQFMENETRGGLRESLLKYCKYDTTAMIVLHKGLLSLAR